MGSTQLYLDPDFRRDAPKTGYYCVRCQKPIRNPKKAVRVKVDWNTWLVTEGGKELIGADCWEYIKEQAAIRRLQEAIAFVEKNYPLPRCPHGNALRDHAGDKLEPSCGCGAARPDREKGAS